MFENAGNFGCVGRKLITNLAVAKLLTRHVQLVNENNPF